MNKKRHILDCSAAWLGLCIDLALSALSGLLITHFISQANYRTESVVAALTSNHWKTLARSSR